MYQYIDGKIVLTLNDWIAAGLTINQFQNDSKRKYLKILQTGWNGNTTFDVRSVKRLDRLAALETCHGKIDVATAEANSINPDPEIATLFREYTYEDKYGRIHHIPAQTQSIYTNNVSILEAMKKSLGRQNMAKAANNKRVKLNEFFPKCVDVAANLNSRGMFNTLHKHPRTFERIYKNYLAAGSEGWKTLIHPSFGNKSSEKLCEDAKFWLIARYATPISKLTLQQLFDEYNREVINHTDWKPLKDPNTIRLFLFRKDVEPLWLGMRRGELQAKAKYTRQHRTLLPTMRDSIWYGDGTKMNFYYLDSEGKMATTSVYEVIDVYSECLLGHHISKTEDFEAQYMAFRRAIQFSGQKPYEIRFDNQGGHKKLQAGEFFKKLSRLAINTAPYNGNSKTIESAFGRFQSQVMHKLWYFTGQNITAKKEESRANMEFILANKANLPTLDEAIRQYQLCRDEWNNLPHYDSGISHIQMYRESSNPRAVKVDTLEMLSIFGIIKPVPNTYRSNGIEMEVKGVKYCWEVLNAEGQPDLEFLRKNSEQKFHISYDPYDMEIVALYTKVPGGDYRFEAMASKYIRVHRGIQEQDKLDAAFIRSMENRNKKLRLDMQEATEQIMEKYGMHPSQHGLNMPKVKGVNSKKADDIGSYNKKVSEIIPVDTEDLY
jgi:hypothetical protein